MNPAVTSTTTGQQAFELEIEPALDTPFESMQTPENGGKCSRCLRPLKGRYGRAHGARDKSGWYAWCDDCTVAEWAALVPEGGIMPRGRGKGVAA